MGTMHFVIHVSDEMEIARLGAIEDALERHFPGCLLHIFDQTGTNIPGAIKVENIKPYGYAWTLRFLKQIRRCMLRDDVLIKIDPDTIIQGNPVQTYNIPVGCCFGQIKRSDAGLDFLGGFQGYTVGAIDELLSRGNGFANRTGAQDKTAAQAMLELGIPFMAVPHIDLWADFHNYDVHLKIIHWKR